VTQRFVFVAVALAACADSPEPPASVMFVADRTANRIVQFDGVTGEWLGEVAAVDRPSSMRLGPDGMLYVAGFGRSEILRVDARSGAAAGSFFQNTEILEEPVELTFQGSELVVLGNDTQNAIVIDPTGAMVRDVGYPDMRGAHDFVFGNDGMLYVATEYDVVLGTAIQVWDLAAGAMVHRFGTQRQIANATGIVALDDALYVTDYERGRLIRFDAERPEVLAVGLVHPISLEVGLDGLFYVTDERGIHRYDREGNYVSLFVPIGEQLVGPRSVTFVPRDELAAAD
jgi:sugar lactone lactonase YvrE